MGLFLKPSLSSSTNLHCLKLTQVKIVDKRFFKWISRCCKFLEELQLIWIRGIQNITVESSSLESFVGWVDDYNPVQLNISGKKLESIDIHWNENTYSSVNRISLKIFVPNLKNLQWEGSLRNSPNLGKLMSLEKLRFS